MSLETLPRQLSPNSKLVKETQTEEDKAVARLVSSEVKFQKLVKAKVLIQTGERL